MLDRKLQPSFVNSTSLNLPIPHRQKLTNGVTVYSFGTLKQNTVKIEAISESGKWFEPQTGIADFTAQMLEKGTHSKSSMEIAEVFEHHGASLEIHNGSDYTSVSLYSLNKHLRELMPVFLEVLSQPNFPNKEIELIKNIFLQALRVNNEKTSYLSSKMLRKKVFGDIYPYGRSVEENDVNKINKSGLEKYFREQYAFDKVFVTGTLDEDSLSLLSNLTGFRPNSGPSPNTESSILNPAHNIVNRSKSVQSSIRLGRKIVLRNHPDYFKILILNHYLGGFFGSQLMKNLRENKGLTYGISSSINSFRHDGLLAIGTDVNKENREAALTEIQNELKSLRKGKLVKDDLELARRHFIGSLQTEVANPFSILNKIKNLVLNDLPEDHYQSMINTIDKVSTNELIETAEVYFHEDTFFGITVG